MQMRPQWRPYSVCSLLTPLVVRGCTLLDGALDIPLYSPWVLILKGPPHVGRRVLCVLLALVAENVYAKRFAPIFFSSGPVP